MNANPFVFLHKLGLSYSTDEAMQKYETRIHFYCLCPELNGTKAITFSSKGYLHFAVTFVIPTGLEPNMIFKKAGNIVSQYPEA